MRPDVALVGGHLRHGGVQIHNIFITKETVAAQSLRPGPGGDVPGVAVRGTDFVPVSLHRHGDQRRGVGFGRALCVVGVLRKRLHIGEVLHQFGNQLLLLAGRRTPVRQDFHPFPGSNVPQVATTSTFDVGTLDDQSSHSSPSFHISCGRPRDIRPLVDFTLRTLSARRRRSSSRLS